MQSGAAVPAMPEEGACQAEVLAGMVGPRQVRSPRGRKEQAGSSATRRGGTRVLEVGGTFHPGPHSCTSAGTISALTSQS